MPQATGGSRPPRPATAAISLGLVAGLFESAGDHLGAILEARDHGTAAEARQFLVAVADGPHPLGALPGVEAELGRGGTGIDGQDLAARVLRLGSGDRVCGAIAVSRVKLASQRDRVYAVMRKRMQGRPSQFQAMARAPGPCSL